jgi:hypothetical protein
MPPPSGFPIVLSNPPPTGGTAPNGRNGLAEVAAVGVSFIRTGRDDWSLAAIDAQIAAEKKLLDAAQAHGLRCWLWLGDLTNLPAKPSPQEQMLATVADTLQGHPALGAYKGVDEPANPYRSPNVIPPAGLVRGYQRLKEIDAAHPLVIIQAPLGTVAQLTPYRPAFDITGADVYPVSYPPATHTETANKDISVVGDITQKMVEAAGPKPVWTTLQIAWSGVVPSKQHPAIVPRFPSLADERFMAYQAVVAGARGLVFFGGHLTQIASPADAVAGWNWTFWERVLQPLVAELTSAAIQPALVAPESKAAITAGSKDVQLVARADATHLYVIAVRRGGTTGLVKFSGLPSRHDGTAITAGEALLEYVQQPPPPPVAAGQQVFRPIRVAGRSFADWFAPHDARVYRFQV